MANDHKLDELSHQTKVRYVYRAADDVDELERKKNSKAKAANSGVVSPSDKSDLTDQLKKITSHIANRQKGMKLATDKIVRKEDVELDEVAKATLNRYRAKAKANFRAKGGLNAALDNKDKKEQPRKKAANEEEAMPHIVDAVMVNTEVPADLYIESFELRLNAAVDAMRETLRKTLFSEVSMKTLGARVDPYDNSGAEKADKKRKKKTSAQPTAQKNEA